MDYSKLTTDEVLDTLVKYSQDIAHFEEAKSNHPDVDFSDAIASSEKMSNEVRAEIITRCTKPVQDIVDFCVSRINDFYQAKKELLEDRDSMTPQTLESELERNTCRIIEYRTLLHIFGYDDILDKIPL